MSEVTWVRPVTTAAPTVKEAQGLNGDVRRRASQASARSASNPPFYKHKYTVSEAFIAMTAISCVITGLFFLALMMMYTPYWRDIGSWDGVAMFPWRWNHSSIFGFDTWMLLDLTKSTWRWIVFAVFVVLVHVLVICRLPHALLTATNLAAWNLPYIIDSQPAAQEPEEPKSTGQ